MTQSNQPNDLSQSQAMHSATPSDQSHSAVTRRAMLATSLLAGTAAAGSLISRGAVAQESTAAIAKSKPADADYKVQHGLIQQSVMGWCFNPMPTRELIDHAKAIGLAAIEGIASEHYDYARSQGLKISLVSSHGFTDGPVNRDNHAMCIKKLRDSIDLAKKYECPNVITFTGMSVKGMSNETADKNCIDCWKEVIGYAEEQEINLCLEHLNSRDDTHPMKGHPGYYGDNVDHCIELIKRVDSPRMKLLFDIYHVQIMNGDVIRRMRMYRDYIGHYHTAGNPGRGELDDNQEINYPPIMREILKSGFKGFVAQEFIPTWDDKIAALRQAVQLCDVTI